MQGPTCASLPNAVTRKPEYDCSYLRGDAYAGAFFDSWLSTGTGWGGRTGSPRIMGRGDVPVGREGLVEVARVILGAEVEALYALLRAAARTGVWSMNRIRGSPARPARTWERLCWRCRGSAGRRATQLAFVAGLGGVGDLAGSAGGRGWSVLELLAVPNL